MLNKYSMTVNNDDMLKLLGTLKERLFRPPTQDPSVPVTNYQMGVSSDQVLVAFA